MKKEILTHFGFFIIFFLLISLFKKYFEISYVMFFLGGVVGTILPDVDHFVYIKYLRPHELSSQRANAMLSRNEFLQAFSFLASTRSERKKLIFHTAWFQILFLIVTLFVIASSGNLFGRGLVLSFSLHLLVDQFVDLMDMGSLQNWLSEVNITLSREKAILFWLALFLFLSFLAFLM